MLLPESNLTNTSKEWELQEWMEGSENQGAKITRSHGLSCVGNAGQALCSEPTPGQTLEEGNTLPPSRTTHVCIMETSKKNQISHLDYSNDLAKNLLWGFSTPAPLMSWSVNVGGGRDAVLCIVGC